LLNFLAWVYADNVKKYSISYFDLSSISVYSKFFVYPLNALQFFPRTLHPFANVLSLRLFIRSSFVLFSPSLSPLTRSYLSVESGQSGLIVHAVVTSHLWLVCLTFLMWSQTQILTPLKYTT
jgi:hypothetical protein